MAVKVKLLDGIVREFDADTACIKNYGRLLVLAKWHKPSSEMRVTNAFAVERVVWAMMGDGRIVRGKGRVASAPAKEEKGRFRNALGLKPSSRISAPS
jgi:hypothetical protein